MNNAAFVSISSLI